VKPICVKCRRFFRPFRTGVRFVEGMPDGAGLTSWSPYKLWCGDLWRCPDCNAEVIVGVGSRPISEHFMKGFAEATAAAYEFNGRELIQIDDC